MRVGVLALLGASGCAGLGFVGWPASPVVAVPVEAPARVRLTVVDQTAPEEMEVPEALRLPEPEPTPEAAAVPVAP